MNYTVYNNVWMSYNVYFSTTLSVRVVLTYHYTSSSIQLILNLSYVK